MQGPLHLNQTLIHFRNRKMQSIADIMLIPIWRLPQHVAIEMALRFTAIIMQHIKGQVITVLSLIGHHDALPRR